MERQKGNNDLTIVAQSWGNQRCWVNIKEALFLSLFYIQSMLADSYLSAVEVTLIILILRQNMEIK